MHLLVWKRFFHMGCHLSLQWMQMVSSIVLLWKDGAFQRRIVFFFVVCSVRSRPESDIHISFSPSSTACPGPQTTRSFEVMILMVLECPTVAISLEQSKKPSLMFASRTATCSFNLDPSRLARAKVWIWQHMRKQIKIQEVLSWQEVNHGTPYHMILQTSRPLDCCCKTSVMPLILKAQTLFFLLLAVAGSSPVEAIYPSPPASSSSGRRTFTSRTPTIEVLECLEPPNGENRCEFLGGVIQYINFL